MRLSSGAGSVTGVPTRGSSSPAFMRSSDSTCMRGLHSLRARGDELHCRDRCLCAAMAVIVAEVL